MKLTIRMISAVLTGTLMLAAFAGCADRDAAPSLKVTSLLVENAANPVGIDSRSPVFSWCLSDPSVRGQKQTAYRIGVASSENKLRGGDYDVWDSGKIESGVTADVVYGGNALEPSTRYFWQVTVWDKDGVSVTSDEPAFFETGLMSGGFDGARFIGQNAVLSGRVDFDLSGAKWIWLLDGDSFSGAKAGTEYFRYEFTPESGKRIKSAMLLFSADDYGKVYFNGELAADIENVYDRWRTGNAVDLTDNVKSGENLLAAAIDNASTGYGGFIAKLVIRYEDGSESVYVTDKSWLVTRDKADGFEKPDFDGGGFVSPDQAENYGASPWGTGVSVPSVVITGLERGSAPIVRRTFNVNGKIRSARAYATAAGLYKLDINGKKAGDDFLTPGFTEYCDHLMYQTFDITDLLKEGENTVSATLGNGWYIGTIGESFGGVFPALLMKIIVDTEDGSRIVVNTDGEWEYTLDGPVTANDLFDGESYDATRLEKTFNYKKVTVFSADELGMGEVISQIAGTNIRNMDVYKPVAVTNPTSSSIIYDFGQNLTGVVEITVKAQKGTVVKIRHGEMLNDGSAGSDGKKGTLYTANLRSAKATDTYTCGGNTETWSPSFTFHGFRYAEVTGIAQEDIVEIKALVLYSSLADSSTFECSSGLINQLSHNAYHGQRGNFVSVPTDCPQRDERMGWSGDAQIFVGTAAYQMDTLNFFKQYIMDLNDCQRENGAYPDCAPASDRPSYNGSGHGGWADAGIIIPYTMALRYGDTSLIETYYDNMSRYIEYLVKDAGDFIRNTQFAYGDWLSFGESTPVELCDTAYCAYVTHLMSVMAGWMNNTEDAAKFEDYSQSFKEAWLNRYYRKNTGKTTCDSQTSYVLGLYFEIFQNDDALTAATRLNEKIIANGNRLTTGFMGVSYLLPVLCEYGYIDTAFALLEQTECPSWLYPVLQGATTIWERWNSYTLESGFGDVGMNSFNHYSYGSVMEWVYSTLLGIRCGGDLSAYSHFTLYPTCGGSLTYAKGSYRSRHGLIESGWKLENGKFIYDCVVPANTTATLYLPCGEDASVKESGEAVAPVRYENGRAVFELESGTYSFTVE